jgi:hypothetical protein
MGTGARTDLFGELLIEDNKLLLELDNASQDHGKVLDTFSRRVTLYKKYADRQIDPIIRAIIEWLIMSCSGNCRNDNKSIS